VVPSLWLYEVGNGLLIDADLRRAAAAAGVRIAVP